MKALLALLLMVSPALATEGPVEETICLAKAYDGAHLARHPEQLVTGMRVIVGEDLDRGGTGQGWYWMKIDIQQRGKGPGIAVLLCEQDKAHKQTIWCATPEKYGGGVLTLTDDSAGNFTLRVKDWITIASSNTMGRIDGVDDKVFKLSAVDCPKD